MALGFACRGKGFAIVSVPEPRKPKPKKTKRWVWCPDCLKCHYEGQHATDGTSNT